MRRSRRPQRPFARAPFPILHQAAPSSAAQTASGWSARFPPALEHHFFPAPLAAASLRPAPTPPPAGLKPRSISPLAPTVPESVFFVFQAGPAPRPAPTRFHPPPPPRSRRSHHHLPLTPRRATALPHAQMTFAIITPALIVGGFAERMKFSAMVVFISVRCSIRRLPRCLLFTSLRRAQSGPI